MPRLQTITTNFTAGEFSPLLEGRADIEKFNSSAKRLRNVEVLKQGGARIRPPTYYLGDVKDNNYSTRLVPFVFSRDDAYMLEFGNLYMRVWRNRQQVESSPGVPYELVTPFTALEVSQMDFTQSGDSMILTVGTRYPQRLRRFGDAIWEIANAPFQPPAVSEIGERPATTLTLSATTVGAGRTATSGAAAFLASDVGRTLSYGVGMATITAVGSSTTATVTITTAFTNASAAASEWVIGESPLTALTPSAATPVGGSTNLTLAAAGWRAGNVGSLVEVNGGLVRITSFSSDTVVAGVILRELTSTTAAPSDSWALLQPVWREGDGYPRTATFFQQRLWLGSTTRFPQSLWGSRSGLSFDFTPGTDDDSAVYKTAASDQTNPLQFLCASKNLVMLGYGAEFEGKGGIEKPITQTNMQINVESEWGADDVRPVTVGKEILYVERSGKLLRSVFPGQVEGLDTSDLTVFSEHLAEAGIKWISFEKTPGSIVWVGTDDGKMHAVTFNREQNTLAWASGETDGEVEWGATIPEGGRDVTYLSVRRVVGGNYVRFIEYLNRDIERGKFDCMLESTGGGITWPCAHLIGCTVGVVADGVYIGTKVVNGAGNIVLDADASTVARGLPYEAEIIVRAPEVGTGSGTSQGQAMSTNKILVKLYETVGLKVNGEEVQFRDFDEEATLDAQVPAFTGIKNLTNTGWDTGENDLGEDDISLVQDQGMPWTVLALIRSFTVNQG